MTVTEYRSDYLFNFLSIITTKITGKKVVCDDKKSFTQTVDTIYSDHWTGLIHELSHWIAATKKERGLDNLGLASVYEEHFPTEANLKQEFLAGIIGYELSCMFDMTQKELNYVEYLRDVSDRIQSDWEETYNSISDSKVSIRKQRVVNQVKRMIKSNIKDKNLLYSN